MVEATDIDWETINEKLPFERTDEAKEKRKALFKQFDPNDNGYLSLAEVLDLDSLTHSLSFFQWLSFSFHPGGSWGS